MESRDGHCQDVSRGQDPIGVSEITVLGVGYSSVVEHLCSGNEALDSVPSFFGRRGTEIRNEKTVLDYISVYPHWDLQRENSLLEPREVEKYFPRWTLKLGRGLWPTTLNTSDLRS